MVKINKLGIEFAILYWTRRKASPEAIMTIAKHNRVDAQEIDSLQAYFNQIKVFPLLSFEVALELS
jgi:hypothetical protein